MRTRRAVSAVERPALGLLDQPFVGSHQEPARPAGRIADRELLVGAGVGLHRADNRLDEDPRGEVLPGALLAFAGRLFQQALVGFGLDVDAQRGPFGLVDEVDELLEVDGIIEPRLGLGVDVAQNALGLAQFAEQVGVEVGEPRAAFVAERGPIAALGQVDGLLVGHFQEEEEGDLLDVIAVVDAIVAEGVAEAPEFLDDVGHERTLIG